EIAIVRCSLMKAFALACELDGGWRRCTSARGRGLGSTSVPCQPLEACFLHLVGTAGERSFLDEGARRREERVDGGLGGTRGDPRRRLAKNDDVGRMTGANIADDQLGDGLSAPFFRRHLDREPWARGQAVGISFLRERLGAYLGERRPETVD